MNDTCDRRPSRVHFPLPKTAIELTDYLRSDDALARRSDHEVHQFGDGLVQRWLLLLVDGQRHLGADADGQLRLGDAGLVERRRPVDAAPAQVLPLDLALQTAPFGRRRRRIGVQRRRQQTHRQQRQRPAARTARLLVAAITK